MKPIKNFLKVARNGDGLFEPFVNLVSEVPDGCDIPTNSTIYLRPPRPDDPPPREFEGAYFICIEQVVYISGLGPVDGCAVIKPIESDITSSTAEVIESNITGIDTGDIVLIADRRVGVDGPDGSRIVHEDSIYGVRKP